MKIDERRTYERVRDFVAEFLPEHIARAVLRRPGGLFDRYGVEDEIERAPQSRVAAPGGHLVIEQTEAMTIDRGIPGRTSARAISKTRCFDEFSKLPRSCRASCAFVTSAGSSVDFIDMEDEEHRRQVLATLEKACESDPAESAYLGISELGLVQISRKRTRESLRQQV